MNTPEALATRTRGESHGLTNPRDVSRFITCEFQFLEDQCVGKAYNGSNTSSQTRMNLGTAPSPAVAALASSQPTPQLKFLSGETVDGRQRQTKSSVRSDLFNPDMAILGQDKAEKRPDKIDPKPSVRGKRSPKHSLRNQDNGRVNSVILQDASLLLTKDTTIPSLVDSQSSSASDATSCNPAVITDLADSVTYHNVLVRNASSRAVESQIISNSFEFLNRETGDGVTDNRKTVCDAIPEEADAGDVKCNPRPVFPISRKPTSRVSAFINNQFAFLPPEDEQTTSTQDAKHHNGSLNSLERREGADAESDGSQCGTPGSASTGGSECSEDNGKPWIYAESFRYSSYVSNYVQDDKANKWRGVDRGELTASSSTGYSTGGSTGSEGAARKETERRESIDTSSPMSPWFDGESVGSSHSRSESISTTASEREFRDRYCSDSDTQPSPSLSGGSCRRRIIRRKSSTSTYKRLSDKLTDALKKVEVSKDPAVGSTYGFHLLGPCPVTVSTVEPDSPAARAGIIPGDTIFTVNDVHVHDSTLVEVVEVISQSSGKVMLGLKTAVSSHDLPEKPICTGFLCKQGDATLFKSWKRRYFELKPDHCLYYYKSEEDKTPMGAISLSNYTVIKAQEVKKDNVFKLVKYGNKTYYLQAETSEEMDRWASAISSLLPDTVNESWLEVSSHNVTLPALSIKSPDCHGYLTKLGGRKKTWRKRYCVLKDACLYYYLDVTSVTAKGVAHLHGYTVKEGTSFNKRFSFTLQPPEAVMRAFYFVAENETDYKRWTSAMEMSIGKWVKVYD